MKKLVLLGSCVMIALFALSCGEKAAAPAADAEKPAATTEPAATTDAGSDTQEAATEEIKEVNNKKCPISGAPVGSMEEGSYVIYKGYKVGLCCGACKDAFLHDADFNLERAQNEG